MKWRSEILYSPIAEELMIWARHGQTKAWGPLFDPAHQTTPNYIIYLLSLHCIMQLFFLSWENWIWVVML